MPLLLAFVSDPTLNVLMVATGIAFLIGVYGHIIGSKPVIIGSIIAIAAIFAFFVVAGELATGTPL